MSGGKPEKIVYFVRHGETTSNLDQIVQGLNDPLTEHGEEQARMIAKRAKRISFDRLFSSDAVRTHETAKIISTETGVPVELHESLREVRRPTSLVGSSRNLDNYQNFLSEEREHFGEDWHFEDEENYNDVLERVKTVIKLLEETSDRSILAVTHGHFLRFLVSFLMLKGELTPDIWRKTGHTLLTINTGVTVCTCTGGLWQLLTWNDHAHFAE